MKATVRVAVERLQRERVRLARTKPSRDESHKPRRRVLYFKWNPYCTLYSESVDEERYFAPHTTECGNVDRMPGTMVDVIGRRQARSHDSPVQKSKTALSLSPRVPNLSCSVAGHCYNPYSSDHSSLPLSFLFPFNTIIPGTIIPFFDKYSLIARPFHRIRFTFPTLRSLSPHFSKP